MERETTGEVKKVDHFLSDVKELYTGKHYAHTTIVVSLFNNIDIRPNDVVTIKVEEADTTARR